MKHLFLLFSIFFLTTSVVAEKSPRIKNLLPKKTTTANHMIFTQKKLNKKLHLKMVKALRKNREWLKGYAQKHKGKTPMPYHKNLGLTKKEYQEYASSVQQASTLKKKSEEKIFIKRLKGKIQITLPPMESDTEQVIVINEKLKTVTSSFGELTKPQEKTEQLPNGPQFSYTWTLREGSPVDGNSLYLKLRLGGSTKDSRGFLHYTIIKMENRRFSFRYNANLHYDLQTN